MGREDLRNERVLLSSLASSGVPGTPEDPLCGLGTKRLCSNMKGHDRESFTKAEPANQATTMRPGSPLHWPSGISRTPRCSKLNSTQSSEIRQKIACSC